MRFTRETWRVITKQFRGETLTDREKELIRVAHDEICEMLSGAGES